MKTEKILSNVNVVVWNKLKRKNSSLPVAVHFSKKTHVPKLPNLSGKMRAAIYGTAVDLG